MSKLWVDRIIDIAGGEISDDADGPAVVIAHEDVEKAMSGIFGIPLGLNITTGIFDNPDTLAGVNSDGKISMMRFKSDSIATDGEVASGLEFYDGTERKRLVLVGSELQVWKQLADLSWELVFNFEEVIEGTLSGKTDAGQKVQDKDPKLDVLAVASDENREYFTLVSNEILQTGKTEFIELDDVSSTFENPFGTPGVPYNPNLAGQGIIIGENSTLLEPVGIEDPDDSVYAFDLWMQNTISLGVGDVDGSGTWKVMGPLSIYSDLDTNPELTDLGGQANGAVVLPAGIYKLKPRFRMTAAGGGGYGELLLRLVGTGFQQHPAPGNIARTLAKPFNYRDVLWAEDWWYNWEPTTTPRVPFVAMESMGLEFIDVPITATVGFGMARTDGSVQIIAGMSVERVQ